MGNKYFYTIVAEGVRGRLTALIGVIVLLICGGGVSYAETDYPEFVPTHGQKVVRKTTDAVVIAMPVATLTGIIIAGDWQGLKQGALTAVTEVAASQILKWAVREDRPDHSNRHSFPSGHTGIAFANATFLQRRYGWKFGVPAYALATYVGWGRVYGKKHHWWDVVAGAALGAGTALIYTRPFAEKHELQLEPSAGPTGVQISASLVF